MAGLLAAPRCYRFSSVATVDATGAGLANADAAQRDGGAAIPAALREPRGVGASSEREAISSGDHVSPFAGCHDG
jgi:hypothetical protein